MPYSDHQEASSSGVVPKTSAIVKTSANAADVAEATAILTPVPTTGPNSLKVSNCGGSRSEQFGFWFIFLFHRWVILMYWYRYIKNFIIADPDPIFPIQFRFVTLKKNYYFSF